MYQSNYAVHLKFIKYNMSNLLNKKGIKRFMYAPSMPGSDINMSNKKEKIIFMKKRKKEMESADLYWTTGSSTA